MTQTNLASPAITPGHKCEICGLETKTKRGLGHHKTTVHRVLGPRTEQGREYRKRIRKEKAQENALAERMSSGLMDDIREANPAEMALIQAINDPEPDPNHGRICVDCLTYWEGTPGPYCSECGQPTIQVRTRRNIRVD